MGLRYFVTIMTPDGRFKRQGAERQLPGSCTIVGTDTNAAPCPLTAEDRARYRAVLLGPGHGGRRDGHGD